jgi:hypothetical protein
MKDSLSQYMPPEDKYEGVPTHILERRYARLVEMIQQNDPALTGSLQQELEDITQELAMRRQRGTK